MKLSGRLSKITTVLLCTVVILSTVRVAHMYTLSNKTLESLYKYENYAELVTNLRSMESICTPEGYRMITPDYLDNQTRLAKISGMPSNYYDRKLKGLTPLTITIQHRVKNPNVSADRIFILKVSTGLLKINKVTIQEVINV